MGKFMRCLLGHTILVSIVAALLLIAAAACLIFWPVVFMTILRYGFAGLNIVCAIWIIVALFRRK